MSKQSAEDKIRKEIYKNLKKTYDEAMLRGDFANATKAMVEAGKIMGLFEDKQETESGDYEIKIDD